MPKVTIDGVGYEYEGKHRLLQFALDQGVEIPYFCYHPAMSAPTNCRMCLVDVGFPVKDRETGQVVLEADGSPKINWGRKPATACNTDLAPDMYVRTNHTSPAIEKAQKGVLEFILINHPLDCPICDQAGECPLQINTYKFGPEGSRFELAKVHKPKRVQLGPNVMLDAERCINCTRCVRFTEEISGTNQLSIMARGDKNFPTTGPGKVFDDKYSMNTIDICPVGALTSTDFRFKARVWEMNYTPSICTGCARSCSVDVWVRDNQVLRLTPRENKAVNQYWMCDEGRLDYMKYNTNRISGAKARGDVPFPSLQDGVSKAAQLLNQHKGKILFVGSGKASLESNFVLRELAQQLGSKEVVWVNHTDPQFGDNLLRKNERVPNGNACRMLGFVEATVASVVAQAKQTALTVILEDEATASAVVAQGGTVIALATNHYEGHDKAEVNLPAASTYEQAGIYINIDHVAQLTYQAKQIARMTPEMWMAMPKSRLDAGGQLTDNWRSADHVFDALPSWMILVQLGQTAGLSIPFASHKELFQHLKQQFDVLKDLNLSKKNRKESFKHNQFEFALGR